MTALKLAFACLLVLSVVPAEAAKKKKMHKEHVEMAHETKAQVLAWCKKKYSGALWYSMSKQSNGDWYCEANYEE